MKNLIRKFFKAAGSYELKGYSILDELEGQRERNEKRMAAIKEEMGDKYILADCHKKTRLDKPRPV